MHMPVISPAKTATVATHAWTKIYTQIMGRISSVYECAVYAWSYLNHHPQFTPLWAACCWKHITTTTTSHACFNFSCLHFRSPMLHSGCSLHLLSIRRNVLNALIWNLWYIATNGSAVPLVWGSLRLTPIMCSQKNTLSILTFRPAVACC